jgi:hypothetical protein
MKKLSVSVIYIYLVLLFSLSEAMAQENQKVISVMGRAEIISEAVRREAKIGDFIKPGESIRLMGTGEVNLEGNAGKVNVSLKDNTTLTYDGDVNINSRPWKDGVAAKPVLFEQIPENERAPQFSVSEGKAEVQVVPG